MKNALFFLALAAITVSASAEQLGWEVCACKQHSFQRGLRELIPGESGDGKKYARDREIDILHLALDITPDFEKRDLDGVATLTFQPIAKPFSELRLDAVDLAIESVESTAPITGHEIENDALVITFEAPIPAGNKTTVTIAYEAQPIENGLYFRTEAMGYPAGDDHLWTQGEPEGHRHWFPCYDYPNERFTTEMTCRVPEGMTVLSNGRKTAEATTDGVTTITWLQDQPHVNYLISLVAGHFRGIEDELGDLPIGFYTTPSNFAQAESSFADTGKILDFFNREIGVDYPWDKYFSVCVADFVAGGMENTSLTTLYDGTLFEVAESENLRSTHRLDAHEVAHQWFGNLVTCKDWSQLWLNEGFATYYTHLYENERSGREGMLYGLWNDGNRVLNGKDERPMTWRQYSSPMEQFDNRAYPKGSWILHMLRSQLGPDLFRDCIRTYLDRNRDQVVETADLREAIEDLSGRNWDRFFDQWVHHGGQPALKVSYNWDEKKKQAKLSVAQTHKVSEKVLLFDVPLPIRFMTEEGTHDFVVDVVKTSEDFYFDLPSQPKRVRVDPDLTVLTKIEFKKPNPLLFADLEAEDDVIGRLRAVQALGGRKDDTSVGKLNKALNADTFYGVRVEAAKALAKTHTPEALRLLTGSMKQEDARARQEVVRSIGKFFDPSAREALQDIVASEKNALIVGAAITALGKFPEESIVEALTTALDRPSYREGISVAALRAIGTSGDPELLDPILVELKKDGSAYQSRDFGNGLQTLAKIARESDETDQAAARDYLLEQLSHPKSTVRTGAIRALGTLGDPSALGAMRTFVDAGDRESREFKAAEEAIKTLNGEKPQSTEVKDLRSEVLKLQKGLRDLEKRLEAAGSSSEEEVKQ